MKTQKDLLIIARPDHSLQIYSALCEQQELSFDFICFKVVPLWLKKLFPIKKLFPVSRNAHISIYATLVNLSIYKWHLNFAKYLTEDNMMERKVSRLLKKNDYRIIHHWPTYDYNIINKYRVENPKTITLADMHMPCAEVVYDEMKAVYQENELDITKSPLAKFAEKTAGIIKNEPVLIVPSNYVAETFHTIFPRKEYVIVPYGINHTASYIKRERHTITQFVYAGTVSLEKGCDLLFECFKETPDLVLHVYGIIPSAQEAVFKKYKALKNIIFHGQVLRQDMLNQMKDYDYGIHLSRFDAYSLSVGEMLGSGLPVIVSDKTGNKDDIKKLDVGFIVELEKNKVLSIIHQARDLDNYRRFINNIDCLMQSGVESYGQRMIKVYSKMLANE